MNGSTPRVALYEPLLELASGGMATVFLARHLAAAGFDRLVVLKRVHPHLAQNPDFVAMFRDEARIASLIRHANVVPVIDVIEEAAGLSLVQEYVESVTLAALLRASKNDRIPLAIVSRIVSDALAGLQAAHEACDAEGVPQRIIHRDVSPQNILVGVDGTSRLIDFGIAKAERRLAETLTGNLKGKAGYMSPEQVRGADVDHRSDIFSIGVVLFEALTDRRLFGGENALEAMQRVLSATIARPSSLVPELSPAIDRVVERALARDPEERFSTTEEMLVALEDAAPPASTRTVAAYVGQAGGRVLSERRGALSLARIRRAAASDRGNDAAGNASDEAADASIASLNFLPGAPSDPAGLTTPATSVTRPSRAHRVPPHKSRGIVVALAAMTLVAVVGSVGLARRPSRASLPAVAAASPPSPSEPGTTPTGSVPPLAQGAPPGTTVPPPPGEMAKRPSPMPRGSWTRDTRAAPAPRNAKSPLPPTPAAASDLHEDPYSEGRD